MEINQVYVKDDMRIGVIGISGKGKSTFLNHLIENDISNELEGLIGKENKEREMSGQTKNPIRYFIGNEYLTPVFKVSKLINNEVKETTIELDEVVTYSQSDEKCSISMYVKPSKQFKAAMDSFNLKRIELIDTQGILDSLDKEISAPLEILSCSVLLYLYDSTDQGSRGDYIEKYRTFLNSVLDKPIIFLETNTQWQVSKSELSNIMDIYQDKLEELDTDFSIHEEEIKDRYTILTKNDEFNNNEKYLLNCILSASQSSVNFYRIKVPRGYNEEFKTCLNLCSAHVMNKVFNRLETLKSKIVSEFAKAKGEFKKDVSFELCYGLLSDVFQKKYRRIDYNSNAYVLRYARHDASRFIDSLKALNNGDLFNISFSKSQHEIHTQFGFHLIYETYVDQKTLDCMQILLDLYMAYLRNITNENGDKLSKAVRMYIAMTISSEFSFRDTAYHIQILNEDIFKEALEALKKWIGDIPVEKVIYQEYKNFDDIVNDGSIYYEDILYWTLKEIEFPNSLITKLDYLCMIISNKMSEVATETFTKSTGNLLTTT